MISVICVYNNINSVESMLVQSLESQSIHHERILVDNSTNRFNSAASALNYGAEQAKGNILIFCHQDIIFEEINSLEKIQDTINQFGGKVVVGVAGRNDNDEVVTNITHGPFREYAGSQRADEITTVQVLDEVLVATSREVFNRIKFDSQNCTDWHFYGVDFCLSALSAGVQSVVVPIHMHHNSQGKLSKAYFKTLVKVAKKHRKDHKVIRCTMSTFRNTLFGTVYYVNKHMLSLKIRGQL